MKGKFPKVNFKLNTIESLEFGCLKLDIYLLFGDEYVRYIKGIYVKKTP